LETGVSFGVPWTRGAMPHAVGCTLTANGSPKSVQSWPLAYWPDGSVKFSGHATVAAPAVSGAIVLVPGSVQAGQTLATQNPTAIDIGPGRLQCRIPRQGSRFIESITVDGRAVARAGRLICRLADEFTGSSRQVTLEQNGLVRAVVKIEGVHA